MITYSLSLSASNECLDGSFKFHNIIDIEKIKDAHSKARSEAKKMIAYKHSR